ncbi:5783_t:CDS:1 [Racocetra persica]|uniref:5783_t:CDS:1 n=1 Tax=Racocetra persica TaxID=160502 RepID=A0ACA9LVR5_9GLOM|nr:5783_t:CDS:1 [Racocetra persica]
MKIRTSFLFLLFTSTILTNALPILVKRQNNVEIETDNLLFKDSIQQFLDAKAKGNPKLDFNDDGCSNSPDHPFGFNFLPSCQRHDFGYRNYKNQGRFTEDNRAKIDNNFKKDMFDICKEFKGLKSFLGVKCRRIAEIYFNAVRAFGNLDDIPLIPGI